ncbi:glutaredoxin family protein [Cryobacterium sp. Y11]|uniref:glutaredoxin family protein n=1 Tax=Cryobacterium sp. Y11 TaxID=2045016 RepID=UPI000CE389DC|nr:glutaredoxin family protein [Cryobacterium sp. Y11]
MASAHLTLIGKPGCHLCDDARDMIGSVLAQLEGEASAPEITFEERSILDDAELHDLYLEDIPVLLINGKVHNYWRIDPVRLRTALLEVS